MASVVAALERFFADDTLDVDNAWKCSRCARAVQAVKSFRLETAPNVLVITLKRFAMGRNGKITRPVAYPATLDLAQHLTPNAPDTAPATYSLFAVLVHLSDRQATGSGHCKAFVRNGAGAWFRCDDSKVQRVEAGVALGQMAYLLFYVRNVPRTGPSTLCPPFRAPAEAAPCESPALHVRSGGASSEAASDDASPSADWQGRVGSSGAWRVRVALPGACAGDVQVAACKGGVEVAAKGWAPLRVEPPPGFALDPESCRFVRSGSVLVVRFARLAARQDSDCLD